MKIISSCCFSFPLLFFHKMVQNGPVAIRPQVSFFSFFFFNFYLFIYFGCVGSSLLHTGFL